MDGEDTELKMDQSEGLTMSASPPHSDGYDDDTQALSPVEKVSR